MTSLKKERKRVEPVQPDLKILILEDEPADVILINHELRKAGLKFHTQRVETRDEYVNALKHQPLPDLILSDSALPSFTGYSALSIARDLCPEIPFIFVTGSLGEERAIETLKSGATDYVLKSRLANLVPAIQRALRETGERAQRQHVEQALRESEARFRMVIEGIKDYAIFTLDPAGCVTSWNLGAEWITGFRANDVLGRHFTCVYPSTEVTKNDTDQILALAAAEGRFEEEGWRLRKGGERFWANTVISALREGGVLRGFVHVTRDITQRKLTLEALRQSESRKGAMLTTALDAIMLVDHEGTLCEWNPAAEKIFGYPRSAAVGRKMDDLIIPSALRAVYHDGLAEYLVTGVGSLLGRPIEIIAMRADKKEIRIELAITRIPDEEPPMFACFIRDITERKAAEDELRKSEERYRMMVDHVEDYAIYLLDTKGRVATWNAGAERIEGYRAEEIIGQSVACLFPDPSKLAEVLAAATAQGRYRAEEWRTRRDGSRYWVNMVITALRDEAGQLYGFTNIARDITERKRAEERFRLVVEAAPNAILLVDQSGCMTYVNSQVEKVFGFERAELFGQPVEKLVPPRFRGQHAGFRAVFTAEPRARPMGIGRDLYGLRKDGSEVPIEVGLNPLEMPEGKFVLCSIVDITQRKHAEAQIHKFNSELEERVRERTAQLEAANQELEAFSYSISHDLRAPLRHINGYVEVLLSETAGRLEEKALHHLQTIAESATHLGRLIDKLLEFSRMSRSEMHRTKVNLMELTQTVLKQLQPDLRERKIQWVIHPLPEVPGDPALLRQVLANLLSNAIKYTRSQPNTRIEVGAQDQANEWVIYVRDNGVGFDPDYADKLFGVFQRLHRASEFEGIGIGLANVRRIIQRHGGHTWAEGAKNQGATFYFSVPKSKAKDDELTEMHPAGG